MWLLPKNLADKIEAASRNPDATMCAAAIEFMAGVSARDKEPLKITGNVAVIPIRGILTEKPSFWASFYGGGSTSYQDIRADIAEAKGNPFVTSVEYEIESPGGNVSGLFPTLDAMGGLGKPSVAIVGDMATSAAFGIACQADEIHVGGRASQLGSVGVAYDTYVDDKELSLNSTEAPNKRPDLSTKEGQGVVVSHLDDYHVLFAGAIATGRGTTVKDVNKNYGRGGIVLANEALKAGMIDKILGPENKQTANGGEQTEVGSMDLQTLKTEHPVVYAAVVKEERGRVNAHLILGKKSGDMDTAIEAIGDGSALTDEIQAKYLAASMDRQDIDNRTADNPDTDSVATEKAKSDTLADKIAAHVEEELGV